MTSRRPIAGLLAILPLAVLLLSVTVLPLPARVPTHWSGRTPDGWTSGPAFLSASLTATVLAAIAAATIAVLRRAVPEAWSRWVVTAAAAVGWGAVLLYAVTVWRTDVDGPDGVREVWAMLALAGGLVAGVLGYVVHGRRVPTLAQVRERVPERSRVQALRGRAVRPVDPWATDVSSTTLRVLGWVLLAVFAATTVWVLVAGESLVLAVFVALVGGTTAALALAWSAVRLHVDADGLTVRSRVLPVRVSRVPAEEIVARLVAMQERGCDIAKMAVMPADPGDVLTLLGATWTMASQHPTTPVITMSMSGRGLISRMAAQVVGSCATFAMVGRPSAPGQVPVEQLQPILALVDANL